MELDFSKLNSIDKRITCSVEPVFSCRKCGSKNFYYKLIYPVSKNIMVRFVCLECEHAENLPHIENLKKRSPSLSAKWRRDVLERDGWRCRICGATENLEAHHIIPVAVDKGAKYIYDRNNGITLCHTCHSMIPTYM